MKIYVGIATLCFCCLGLLSACASSSSHSETPGLNDYQSKTLPSGGSDAALAAHTF